MSDDKLIPQKYYQREQFTSAERQDVLNKSNGLCAHCGKPLSKYNMTVDHFIPLFKGGSNRAINLIPLCEDCNKNKDDKLYQIEYISHLGQKHLDNLKMYLDSYIAVTDYVQRHRLLAYDEYEDYILAVPSTLARSKKFKNKKQETGIKTMYKLKLATWDDINKLTDYLIRYLKKYKSLDSEESARQNIIFWLQFGCIYYIERDNDIKIMFAITIKRLGENEDFRGIDNQPYIYVFSYYMSDITCNMLLNTLYTLPNKIMEENSLSFMPVNLLFIKKDKIKDIVSSVYGFDLRDDAISAFTSVHGVIGNVENTENVFLEYNDMSDREKKVYDFFRSFDNVTEEIIKFFERYSSEDDITWMLNSLFSAKIIKDDERLRKLVQLEEVDLIDEE